MEHIHFIGIGGTGLSAIARVLHESDQMVSGSDRALSPLAASLRADGVTVYEGHAASNISGATLVVRSSAIPDSNVEVQAAQASGIPVLKRSDFLGRMMEGKTGIAIAGTHGKTTTTSMIAWMLTALGLDPTFISGGVIANLNTNARAGKGTTFVIEADEYDRMFLGLKPTIAVITNIEHDHPDCFPTPKDFFAAFREFTALLPSGGTLILCLDDPGVVKLLDRSSKTGIEIVTYGLSDDCLMRGTHLSAKPGAGFHFDLYFHQEFQTQVFLQVPGRHNVLNALAALSVAQTLGLSLHHAARALAEYRGAGRRFEIRGEVNGVLVVDDYAHHPTEIRATLSGARSRYPNRSIWAVWQPHTYSRTLLLAGDFAASFSDADHVIVTDVYPSREIAPEGFSLQPILEAFQHRDARHIPTLREVSEFLVSNLHPGDVVIILSAGDADQISQNILVSYA